MPYLRVTKTPLVRRTPLGTYLCFPHGFQLESFYPIMEIEESVEELLTLCNGQYTSEDILVQLARGSGESVEDLREDFDAFIKYMVGEGILEWSDNPSYVEPLHKRDKPFSISFDITYRCNLECSFCSVNAGAPHPDELEIEDIAPFVDQMKKLKPSPLMINGGEPLMRKEMLLYILEELSPVEGIIVPVLTNGTLLTKDYAQTLYDAGLKIGRIGLDGHCEKVHDAMRGKGTFKKTLKGIENLKELGVHVNVIAIISRLNYPYLKEIRDFLEQIADSYNISPVYPFGRAGSDMLLSQEETFKVKTVDMKEGKIETLIAPRCRCDTGDVIHIAANGDIYPCFYMQAPEFKVGNIKKDNLIQIYTADVMEKVLNLEIKDFEECSNCSIRYFCGGGCRGFAYAVGNSLYGPDPLDCESNKILVQAILENGEETTKRVLKELLKSTRELR
ncbi:MAG: radical SAM protein [Candidatus Methanofastidiosia archaeon]|jgi:radical SAM protein with 4Fe4S-binding SPASM domain